jgi:hypothetical protein
MDDKINEVLETGSWTDIRLIMYLMGKRGAPGMLYKDCSKTGSLRLDSLINLVDKEIIKICYVDGNIIYFRFADTLEIKKISVKECRYI